MSIPRTATDTLANVRYRRSRRRDAIAYEWKHRDFPTFFPTVLQKNQSVSRNNPFIDVRRTYRQFDSHVETTRIARTIPIVRGPRHNPAVSYFEAC